MLLTSETFKARASDEGVIVHSNTSDDMCMVQGTMGVGLQIKYCALVHSNQCAGQRECPVREQRKSQVGISIRD